MSNLDDIWNLWREKAPGLELHIYYVESFGAWVVSCARGRTRLPRTLEELLS